MLSMNVDSSGFSRSQSMSLHVVFICSRTDLPRHPRTSRLLSGLRCSLKCMLGMLFLWIGCMHCLPSWWTHTDGLLVRARVLAFTHACTCACIHSCVHVCLRSLMRARVLAFTHACTCACIHSCKHKCNSLQLL